MTGNASACGPLGLLEQANSTANETLAAMKRAGEGQRSAPVPDAMPDDERMEMLDDGRKLGTHLPTLHEVQP